MEFVWLLVVVTLASALCCAIGCIPILVSMARCCFLFWPPTRTAQQLDNLQRSRQYIALDTAHGTCAATFWPQYGAKITILYSHASAEDLVSLQYTLHRLRTETRTPFNFMAYDYPGYSCSEPRRGRCWWRCSENPLTVFAEAALDWLVLTRKIPLHRIVVYGRSIGSGPAVQLVSERPNSFAGLVLESSLASVVGVKCALLAKLPCVECMDMFVNHRKIKNVKCPVLFLHGTEDRVTGLKNNAELLADEATQAPSVSRIWVPGAGHNDLKLNEQLWGDYFFKGLDDFLSKVQNTRQATPGVVDPSDALPSGHVCGGKGDRSSAVARVYCGAWQGTVGRCTREGRLM